MSTPDVATESRVYTSSSVVARWYLLWVVLPLLVMVTTPWWRAEVGPLLLLFAGAQTYNLRVKFKAESASGVGHARAWAITSVVLVGGFAVVPIAGFLVLLVNFFASGGIGDLT